jgi:hypothetical protein
VLPDTKWRPSGGSEALVGVLVARPVPRQLLTPPRGIGARPHEVLWAHMPKTAIDEHGYPLPREHNIGYAAAFGKRALLDAESESAAVQR